MLKLSFILLAVLLVFPVMASAQPDSNAECAAPGYLIPRLSGGMYARVISSQPLDVHQDFSLDSPVVGQVQPGAVIPINTAPRCHDGLVWWQSNFRPPRDSSDTPFGWLVEGQGGEYWLEPYLQMLDVPPSRQPITGENFSRLQPVAQVEYGLVNDLVWSPDGSRLAISSVGAVWVHDLTNPAAPPLWLRPNGVDTNLTTDIIFSGDVIALAGASGYEPDAAALLQTWSLQNGAYLLVRNFAQAEFGHIAAVSPDLTRVATVDWRGVITLWDAQTATPYATLTGHDLIGDVRFSPDGRTLISTGGPGMMIQDTTVRLWDVATGIQKSLIDLETVPGRLIFSPDGRYTAVADTDIDPETGAFGSRIHLIDVETGSLFSALSAASGGAASLSFGTDAILLVVLASAFSDAQADWTGRIDLIDTTSDILLSSLIADHDLRHIAFSPDGTLLAVVYADPDFWGPDRVVLWAVT